MFDLLHFLDENWTYIPGPETILTRKLLGVQVRISNFAHKNEAERARVHYAEIDKGSGRLRFSS